jgi:hypothetical protein
VAADDARAARHRRNGDNRDPRPAEWLITRLNVER